MTIKEAIMLLNPKTTAPALAEIEYYNGFSGKEACLTKEFVDGHASQYKFCPQCGLEIDWSDEK